MIMRIRTVLGGTQGLPGLSTTYANGAGASPILADATDMVARVRVFWASLAILLPAGNTAQVSGLVDVLNPVDGTLVGTFSVATPALVTGGGGTAAPLAAAVLLVQNTGVIINGRKLLGRTFISPIGVGSNVNGFVKAADQASILAAAGVTLTGSTASVPVVWHRPNPLTGAAGSAHPVNAFVVRGNFAVLRSRRD